MAANPFYGTKAVSKTKKVFRVSLLFRPALNIKHSNNSDKVLLLLPLKLSIICSADNLKYFFFLRRLHAKHGAQCGA